MADNYRLFFPPEDVQSEPLDMSLKTEEAMDHEEAAATVLANLRYQRAESPRVIVRPAVPEAVQEVEVQSADPPQISPERLFTLIRLAKLRQLAESNPQSPLCSLLSLRIPTAEGASTAASSSDLFRPGMPTSSDQFQTATSSGSPSSSADGSTTSSQITMKPNHNDPQIIMTTKPVHQDHQAPPKESRKVDENGDVWTLYRGEWKKTSFVEKRKRNNEAAKKSREAKNKMAAEESRRNQEMKYELLGHFKRTVAAIHEIEALRTMLRERGKEVPAHIEEKLRTLHAMNYV